MKRRAFLQFFSLAFTGAALGLPSLAKADDEPKLDMIATHNGEEPSYPWDRDCYPSMFIAGEGFLAWRQTFLGIALVDGVPHAVFRDDNPEHAKAVDDFQLGQIRTYAFLGYGRTRRNASTGGLRVFRHLGYVTVTDPDRYQEAVERSKTSCIVA